MKRFLNCHRRICLLGWKNSMLADVLLCWSQCSMQSVNSLATKLGISCHGMRWGRGVRWCSLGCRPDLFFRLGRLPQICRPRSHKFSPVRLWFCYVEADNTPLTFLSEASLSALLWLLHFCNFELHPRRSWLHLVAGDYGVGTRCWCGVPPLVSAVFGHGLCTC